MSAETAANFEAALAAHINDEEGGNHLVSGLLLIAAITDIDTGDSGYWFERAQDQPEHVTRGLGVMIDEWASSTELAIGLDDSDD